MHDGARPDVVLVVVTWNSARELPAFLAALPAALTGVPAAALVVADNASGDDTVDIVRRLRPDARIVEVGWNAGYAGAINRAVAAHQTSAPVLVLNPDVRLGPDSVRRLLDGLDADTGICVPRLVDERGRLAKSLRREPTVRRMFGEAVVGGLRAGRFPKWGQIVVDPAAYDAPTQADWASGAAMLISRGCFDAVGGWDESFFLYSEETAFALRARDAGFALRLVPEAEAVHIGGRSHSSPRLWTILTLSRVRLFRQRHGPIHTGLFWLALTLNEGLRALLGRPTNTAAFAALVRRSRRPHELGAA